MSSVPGTAWSLGRQSLALLRSGGIFGTTTEGGGMGSDKAGVGAAVILRTGALAALVIVSALCFMPPPASASGQATGSAGLRDQCIDAALAMPAVKKAYVVYPGRHPYEKSSRDFGQVQEAVIEVRYPLVTEACRQAVRRSVHTRIEKQVGTHWHKLRPGYRWTRVDPDVDNDYPFAGAYESPVNTTYSDWYYWHPGERFRALVETVAKDRQTGQTIAQTDEYFPMKVRRGGGASSSPSR